MVTVNTRYPKLKEAQVEVIDVLTQAPVRIYAVVSYDTQTELESSLNSMSKAGWDVYKLLPTRYPAHGLIIFEKWEDSNVQVDNADSTSGASEADSE